MDKELVDQKLPYWCQDLKDVFSKAVSNTLAPYRLYDYKIKIKLNKENTLSFSPLHQQSTAELQATKQYFIDNLNKGFIALS